MDGGAVAALALRTVVQLAVPILAAVKAGGVGGARLGHFVDGSAFELQTDLLSQGACSARTELHRVAARVPGHPERPVAFPAKLVKHRVTWEAEARDQ